jgi:hypothetical protein
MRRLVVALSFLAFIFPHISYGQVAVAGKVVRELVEQIGIRGGKSASEELVRLGGEKTVQEVLEKAAKEGGEVLVEKTARYSVEYGPIVLRGAKESPLKFISAFEKLPPNLRTGAIQEMRRETELMARLAGDYGETALEIGARHPGVGPTVLSKIGRESSEFLVTHPTDQVIRVSRFADDIARATPAQRSDLMALISRAPEKILNLLETHPNILKTSAALGAFLVAKDQLLGTKEVIIGPDGKLVTIGKVGALGVLGETVENVLKSPLAIFSAVAGLVIAVAALLKLLPLLGMRAERRSN